MTRSRLKVGLSVVVTILVFGAYLRASDPIRVAFPEGYREWVHVKSTVIGPQFPVFATEGGIHHIYANRTAFEGLRTGKFSVGSVLVYDLLSTTENGGVTTEAARRRVDVMVKDGQHAESGDWAFERFVGDNHAEGVLTAEHKTACFGCHEKQRGRGFVFSEFRQ